MIDSGERRLRRLEQELATARLYFALVVGLDVSLMAWVMQNGRTAAPLLLYGGACGVGLLTWAAWELYTQMEKWIGGMQG